MRWVVLSNFFVVNTFFRDRKKKSKHLSQNSLHIGTAHRWLLLSKAICVLSDVRIWAVKEVVKFDVLEESLFPFIISNVSKSTISASLCWNWRIFHAIVVGTESHHFHGWAFSPWTAYRSAGAESGTVLRRGHLDCSMETKCTFEHLRDTLCLLLLFLLRHAALSKHFLKYHRKRLHSRGYKEMTWSSFSHLLVIAKIKIVKPEIYKQIKWLLWTV